MTAADRAKAAELLSLGATPAHTRGARDAVAAALAAARADGEAAANQRWTAAAEGLAEEWEADSRAAQERADGMDRTEENVRHHAAERRHARVAAHAAARLRGLTTSSEEE